MSGKCRPSLRGKTLHNVMRSALSNTDKECVKAVFEKFEGMVEVKHGRWIEDGYYDKSCVCSCCGEEAKYISSFEETFDYDWEENLRPTGYEEIREYIRTPYCPNCGAKMEGKVEDDAEI